MSKRRKKKHEDEGMDESWLLPYADILTLLLALFIVLYSMSSVDAKKFEEISQAFNSVFVGEKGILDETDMFLPEESEVVEPKDEENPDEDEDEKENNIEINIDNFEKAEAQEIEALGKVKEKVDDYIVENSLVNRFETSLTTQGLLITIRDQALFDSGSAIVRSKDEKLATELSELLLMDKKREVVINGHTDNVPIHTSDYKSNWELSVGRSVNFMRLILENDQLDPRYFSAKGSGEHQPIATNDTEEGRAKNRRVEILVMPLMNLGGDEN